jgi:branched-chain amino acid transport system ATP-binding protein
MNGPLLEFRGVSARYGKLTALSGVTLSVRAGARVAIFGHNGAGKTTLLKCAVGAVAQVDGEVFCNETRIEPSAVYRNARLGIGFVPQGHNVFKNLDVARNLRIAGLLHDAAYVDRVFELFPVLARRRSQQAGSLSGGQQQMLALGMALMTRPRIIMLDEPSNGLAPVLVQRVLESIQAINREFGTAVLLVEQNVRQGLRVTRRAYAMKRGRITYAGDCAELLERGHFWDLF